jgi:dihydrolipoamide dehydrogenase
MPDQFDIIVVGGGPGGYVASIRAAQLGFNVAIVEKRKGLGGTCLNIGCIPSKALLDSSELFHQATHNFTHHGIDISSIKLNLKQMMARKDDVVNATVTGVDYLMKKNKITRFEGAGTFVDQNTIQIDDGKNKSTITGKYIIIATGSEPAPLSFAPFDDKHILSSTEALSLKEVPNHLIIIGGGVIGLEIGSIYGRLGAKVSVIEFLPSIIPAMDAQIARTLQKSLRALNFRFHLSTKVTAVKPGKNGVTTVSAEDKKGEKLSFTGDVVLVSIGRRPYTSGLNLDTVGIKTERSGCIKTNKNLQTDCDNIYAIGDVVAGPMLAHKAEEEGVAVAEFIAGEKPEINYDVIPGVIYTWPEVASVGKTEEELKKASIAYNVGSFPFKASGRARALGDLDGFIKVLSDSKTDEILGVHMIGPRCSDMIAEAVVAMEFKATAEDIGRICHPHPTFTESLKEASLMATANRALHL